MGQALRRWLFLHVKLAVFASQLVAVSAAISALYWVALQSIPLFKALDAKLTARLPGIIIGVAVNLASAGLVVLFGACVRWLLSPRLESFWRHKLLYVNAHISHDDLERFSRCSELTRSQLRLPFAVIVQAVVRAN